jgi:hypothetical protein
MTEEVQATGKSASDTKSTVPLQELIDKAFQDAIDTISLGLAKDVTQESKSSHNTFVQKATFSLAGNGHVFITVQADLSDSEAGTHPRHRISRPCPPLTRETGSGSDSDSESVSVLSDQEVPSPEDAIDTLTANFAGLSAMDTIHFFDRFVESCGGRRERARNFVLRNRVNLMDVRESPKANALSKTISQNRFMVLIPSTLGYLGYFNIRKWEAYLDTLDNTQDVRVYDAATDRWVL